MMSIRPKQHERKEWLNVLQNELKTKQQSLVFVKRMVAIAVSSVTYLRGIFPEDAYHSRYLEDLCIKILRQDSNTPGACKILKWSMGCFDALEKGYLRMMFIGVHTDPDDPNCVIESYQFNFRYTDKGPQMDILRNESAEMRVTIEDTKKASVLLIRRLFLLLQNLDVLPNDVSLTMKLFYYDDITPADYEPPGFKAGVCDRMWFEGTAMNLRPGRIQTPFHTLKVCVAAEQGRVEKLLRGNYLREKRQEASAKEASAKEAPTTREHPEARVVDKEELPSEDESAQFKRPRRPVATRSATRSATRKPTKKKRRI